MRAKPGVSAQHAIQNNSIFEAVPAISSVAQMLLKRGSVLKRSV